MQTILVIDDDADIRSLLRDLLQEHGFKVLIAETGEAGTLLARTHLPDLILCDIYMQGLDGYAVLTHLREATATANTPIILMTGQPDLTGLRHGMSLGADDYLPKPFTAQALLSAIRTRLQKHQAILAEAERDLTELRANICLILPHELLTPLTGILSAADLLRRNAQTWRAAEIESFAGMIHQAGRRLHRLVNNCLIYAQIELLATDPSRVTDLRVGKVTRAGADLAKQMQEKAAAHGRPADLVLELASAALAILPEHLARIVEEILDNAFKFSKPGTPVTVRLYPQAGSVHLEVTDHGRGMKPEHIKKVTAYMQFERKLYEQQGFGLGLVLAWRLAELYGGKFDLESEAGRGTTVRVVLPAATA